MADDDALIANSSYVRVQCAANIYRFEGIVGIGKPMVVTVAASVISNNRLSIIDTPSDRNIRSGVIDIRRLALEVKKSMGFTNCSMCYGVNLMVTTDNSAAILNSKCFTETLFGIFDFGDRPVVVYEPF